MTNRKTCISYSKLIILCQEKDFSSFSRSHKIRENIEHCSIVDGKRAEHQQEVAIARVGEVCHVGIVLDFDQVRAGLGGQTLHETDLKENQGKNCYQV